MGARNHNEFTEQMFKVTPKEFYLRTNSVYASDDKIEREYAFYERESHKKAISFRARQLPGCCGVLVVYYLRPVDGKGTKLFYDTLTLIVEAAGKAKYGTVLMTQTVGSLGEKTLGNHARVTTKSFTNWRTKNKIATYMLTTSEPPAPEWKPKFDDEWSS